MKAATLRAQLESALSSRISSPFTFRQTQPTEAVPSGLPEIDSLTPLQGLPRGALTEIFGPHSSGRTSILLTLLAQMTVREEACALVDSTDTFDPHSAQAAGVELERLLWARCSNLEQALRTTDLLLGGGGFGLVAVDLSDVPPREVRRVPLACWFRFRRVVEHTPTVLLFLEQAPYAKTCASLVLHLEPHTVYWSAAAGQGTTALSLAYPPHACLLRGARLGIRIVRSRLGLETGNSEFEARLL